MKKTPLFLIAFLSLTITACSFIQEARTESKDIDVYNLDKLENQGELKSAKQATLNMRFIPNEEYIPCLNLEQYASLFEPHYMPGGRNEFKKDNNSISWYVYGGEDLYFYTYINYRQKYILSVGSIENAFDEDDNPRDLKALNYGFASQGRFIAMGSQPYSRYSYAECDFTCFRNNDDIYMPLGFYDTAFSESAGIYFFYDYQNIYSTRDADNFSTKQFKNAENELLTVDQEMAKSVSSKNMPSYLINYNADLFIFLMNNFYGLKSLKEISSMTKYYTNLGIYKDLYSSDPTLRGRAYSLGLNCFDDNHTALVSVNDTWGEIAGAPFGEGVTLRRALRTELRKQRQNYYQSYLDREEVDGGDILYSQNERTAMFHFETFSFGNSEEVFNEDESIKEDAYKYDTFINFIRIFNEIKAKGTVENVIIDVSTNGGGTVGVMMKLLALISKDNFANVCLCDETYMGVSSYDVKVDVDGNNEYNKEDVFGDDFNIYIMTSDCSFSAGNAFPCYAKGLGVKIIGEKSGGGECAVAIHYLPNSQYVYHSSNLHLGIVDEEYYVFTGFEGGAEVDIDLTNKTRLCSFDDDGNIQYHIPADFYDINALDSRLAN